MKPNIVHRGRGGTIEVGDFEFAIEMQVSEPYFCIYFPRRLLDKTLAEAKLVLESLVASDPEKWELAEYDTAHGFYDAMTVSERLYAAGLSDEFDLAKSEGNRELLRTILREVEVPETDIEEILKDVGRP